MAVVKTKYLKEVKMNNLIKSLLRKEWLIWIGSLVIVSISNFYLVFFMALFLSNFDIGEK